MWADKAVYVIVNKVVPDGKGYGKAYGNPVTDGVLNTYFEYNDKWVNENLIPNAGTYNWIYRNDKDPNIGNIDKNINDIDNKKNFDMEDRINFGKYKGVQIKDILKMDSDYLIWVNNNVKGVSFSDDILSSIKK